MKIVLGNRSLTVTVTRIALIVSLAIAVFLVQSTYATSDARAAGAVSKITSCDSAIGSMNKTLTLIAKRRIQLRTARHKGVRNVKRAKRNLKRAQRQGKAVRAAIARNCAGVSGVAALDSQCATTINSLEKLIDLKYTRTLRYKKLKSKGKSKRAQKRKRAMKTQLKKLNEQVARQSQTFQKACGQSGNGGGNGGSGNGGGNGGSGNGSGNGGSDNGGGGSGGPGNGGGNGPAPDITPPGEVIIDGPSGPISDDTPTIEVTSPESGGYLECKIDNGPWVTVESPWTLPELTDGTHTVTCRYVDGAGNAGPGTTITITIDTTPPGEVTISGPGGPTSDTTPSFNLSGAGTGETYMCSVDGADSEATGNPFTTSQLSEGQHTVSCYLVDEAGNTGPVTTVTVEIDLTAPGSVTITGPGGPTNDTTPTIDVTSGETGGHYECSIDGGPYVTVTPPFNPTLSEDTHSITCRYVDGAGNAGPETTITVVIDTTAPAAPTVNGPAGPTNDNTPSVVISGGGEDVTYQCKIDGGEYVTVPAGYTTPPLTDAMHTITCRAVDQAGNASDGTSIQVTVDTVGPAITITDGTPRWDGTHSFTLGAGGESGVDYQCAIDGGSYATVSASYTTGVLSNGTHSVSCRGTDAAGNTGAVVTKSFGVFKDPAVVSESGGFQWGLGCTFYNSLNRLLGCPDTTLVISIPANPNGLTGSYLVDIDAYIHQLNSLFGVSTTYTMNVTVDGTSVASDHQTIWLNIFGTGAANLDASKHNVPLSAATGHTIQIRLKTSAAIDLLPSVGSSRLSVSIHH